MRNGHSSTIGIWKSGLTHEKKNEVEPLSYTIYGKYLKMDQRPKC